MQTRNLRTHGLMIGAVCALTLILGTTASRATLIAGNITDFGDTPPVLDGGDTGLVDESLAIAEFGWDVESIIQSFTLPAAGTLESIFISYRNFDPGDTITLDISVDGTSYGTGITLDSANFAQAPSPDINWIEFDFSGEAIALGAGLHNFEFDAVANSGASWAMAPKYNNADAYAGGEESGFSPAGSDMIFAVTTTAVPEPSTLALLGLGALAMIAHRRR